MITSGSRIVRRLDDGSLVSCFLGQFTIELTESGFLEPLVEVDGTKTPLWLVMQSLDAGSLAENEGSAKLMNANLKKIQALANLTGLSLLECKASLTVHNWDLTAALKNLFAVLRSRVHGWR